MDTSSKPAEMATKLANDAVLREIDLTDTADFEDAARGFITTGRNRNETATFNPIQQAAPDTVNPSFWRSVQLGAKWGLFKVVDGVYQIRGLDLANITFIRGTLGWVVVDALTSTERATMAVEIVRRELEDLPITGVIITHSHADHFGGVRALVSEDDVKTGVIQLIGPSGFMEEAVSENLTVGREMNRRSMHMYGLLVPKFDPRGSYGPTIMPGTVTLMEPNRLISRTGESVTIDGVCVDFLVASETEAPAAMLLYFPQSRLIHAADNVLHTNHNLLTLRGAKARSPHKWAQSIHEVIEMWGKDVQVLVAGHQWPTWGNDRVLRLLEKQRDLYKYVGDQTARLANLGLSMDEIADQLTLPPSLAKEFCNRDYYGVLKHNIRATYQFYLGWWDGVPAHFDPHPPREEANRIVSLVGAEKMRDAAKTAFGAGDYRWVLLLANRLLLVNPEDLVARQLNADSLEQLGYQCESGALRNYYLSWAMQIRGFLTRHMVYAFPPVPPDVIMGMSSQQLLDFLATHVNGPRLGNRQFRITLIFKDANERFLLVVGNGVLNHFSRKVEESVDATVAMERKTLQRAIGERNLGLLMDSENVLIHGDVEKLKEFIGVFDGLSDVPANVH